MALQRLTMLTIKFFFSSDGAFGGTVFYADMTKMVPLPPMSYYLLPVVYLGFDSVSGSRLIAGLNVNKNFLIMEKPNWGTISYHQFPEGVSLSANDAYDGTVMNYYNVACHSVGSCKLTVWNIQQNNVTTFPLSCLSSNGYLLGSLQVNPLNTNLVLGIQMTTTDSWNGVVINIRSKSCTLSAPLGGLPPKPVILVASAIGPKSGNFYVSVASDAYNAINSYDNNFKYLNQVRTSNLFEDIFVQEN